MNPTLWIDIETRSRVDLKRCGVYRYVKCPDFQILMASYIYNDGPVINVTDPEDLQTIPGLWDPEVKKVAHNAPFERICFSEFSHRERFSLGIGPNGFLPATEWHDTMAVAAVQGYPKSLGNLAKQLGAAPKDEAGTALINWFCKPARDGSFRKPEDHPEKWEEFVRYCDQDTLTLKEVDLLLEKEGNWPTETEYQVFLADQDINDRGIAIDVPLAKQASLAATVATEEQKERVRALTLWEVENPGSTKQMLSWLNDNGCELPNMKAESIERELLRPDLRDEVAEVLELRQDLALAAPAKFGAALDAQVDGRLHGTLAYFGAHTGRWAGRGTQPQNLPRASFKPTPEDSAQLLLMHEKGFPKAEIARYEADAVAKVTEDEISNIMSGRSVSALTLKKTVRPMFLVDGVVVDYSAIEAVVIAWLSGEEWALQAFRDKRDIYVETAERMGGLSRAQGKIAVLALGYNGGAGSLKAMAGDSDYLPVGSHPGRKSKSSTVATHPSEQTEAGMLISQAPDDVLYDMFVYPWRDANANIVKLWAALDKRFRSGGPIGDHLVFEKAHRNRDRLLRLPSGRAISYRKCGTRVMMKPNRQGKMVKREVLSFWSPAGYPADTYGGRLAENVTQAVARDLMAEALVRLKKAGLEVVAHIHDEIVVQGTNDVDLVSEIMCELPSWAEGLPVSGEGFTTYRYKKG